MPKAPHQIKIVKLVKYSRLCLCFKAIISLFEDVRLIELFYYNLNHILLSRH